MVSSHLEASFSDSTEQQPSAKSFIPNIGLDKNKTQKAKLKAKPNLINRFRVSPQCDVMNVACVFVISTVRPIRGRALGPLQPQIFWS